MRAPGAAGDGDVRGGGAVVCGGRSVEVHMSGFAGRLVLGGGGAGAFVVGVVVVVVAGGQGEGGAAGVFGGLDDFGDESGHGEFDVELDDVAEGGELDVSGGGD